jgi:hypothetical protein
MANMPNHVDAGGAVAVVAVSVRPRTTPTPK